jgi:signal peptidase I
MRAAKRASTRNAVLLAVVAAAALMVWPSALGGRTTYVALHGTSMLPRFHTGDLAVVRSTSHYRVGDIVAYHSKLLHTVVMHRIVAIHHGHYTFQGDNNDWLDPETPSRDQLIGTVDLRIPHGGMWLREAATPSVLTAAAFLAASGGALTQTGRTRRRHCMSRHTAPRTRDTAQHWLSPPLRYAAVATAAAGLLGLALGALAWTGPTTTTAVRSHPVSRSMVFSYTASVPRSPAYDTTTVASPAPVFRALTNAVDVNYTYHGAPGRITVKATLSAPSGWRATIPLAASDSFTANEYHGTVRLHLNRLQARADAAAKVIGTPSDQLAVLITATVAAPSLAPFQAVMPLTLTPLQLTSTSDQEDLKLTDTAATPQVVRKTRILRAAGHMVPITTARLTSSALLIAALITAVLLTWLMRRSTPRKEAHGSGDGTPLCSSRSHRSRPPRLTSLSKYPTSRPWPGWPPTTAFSSCTGRAPASTPSSSVTRPRPTAIEPARALTAETSNALTTTRLRSRSKADPVGPADPPAIASERLSCPRRPHWPEGSSERARLERGVSIHV